MYTFMDIEEGPHSVSSAMLVVQSSSPQWSTRQTLNLMACVCVRISKDCPHPLRLHLSHPHPSPSHPSPLVLLGNTAVQRAMCPFSTRVNASCEGMSVRV